MGMGGEIIIYLPVNPILFGVFLGISVGYVVYGAAKFIISIWTGA